MPKDDSVLGSDQAAGQMGKPHAPRGRQLTKVAVALTLLLGAGSVGFYFAKDFNLLPVNGATKNSPDRS
jgi:hypothetical protein